MAVYLYMLSNPSTVALLRIAKSTNYDRNDEVNSIVKSTIESLANLKELKFKRVASKARIARKLLSSKNYDYTYSHGYFGSKIFAEILGSGDSNIPKYILVAAYPNSNQFFVAEYAVSSMKQLFAIFKKQEEKKGPSEVEKLIKRLNFLLKISDELEGNIFLNTPYIRTFCFFDKQDVEKFANCKYSEFFIKFIALISSHKCKINIVSSFSQG